MEWAKSESGVRPAELDTESSNHFNYIRKNIEETKNEEEQIMYVYDELKIAKEDWELFNTVNDSATRIAEVEDALLELAELIGD